MANPDCYVLREVSVNGTRTESRSYTAADQVVGWTYDAAGNLLNDGTTTSAYDALGRLTSTTHGGTTTTRSYNGDGVLIAQSSGNTTTRSTQDLVAPLSQILQRQQGTQRTDYVYGHERLLALEGTAQTWYGSDALGSVRQTLDATGAPLSALHYDPWGTPQGGATPPVFGFTGERQDGTSGLVYLRARWYQPQHGRFLSRDPFAGFPTQPYSLHPYQYGYSMPVLYTDPSGKAIVPPHYNSTAATGDCPGGLPRTNLGCPLDGPPLPSSPCEIHPTQRKWEPFERFDITIAYMFNEMINNAASEDVKEIHAHLALSVAPSQYGLPGIYHFNQAIIKWTSLVCTTVCRWDHKPTLESMLGLIGPDGRKYTGDDDFWFPIRGNSKYEWYYDIWSNIHYGYVGRAAGFPAVTLVTGANMGGLAGRNDAGDNLSIQIGIDLWDNFGTNLTRSRLHQAILAHTNNYLRIQLHNPDVNVLIERINWR